MLCSSLKTLRAMVKALSYSACPNTAWDTRKGTALLGAAEMANVSHMKSERIWRLLNILQDMACYFPVLPNSVDLSSSAFHAFPLVVTFGQLAMCSLQSTGDEARSLFSSWLALLSLSP
ncbi:unnamed protein product [Effrenium voratum]|uniref:Uncharacterized protein n=1 Tax=Effrenium voratum TaxID=2562239 RepID=A0AA36MT27_9DINO|nr:unnamed protein product [Effrenium voratum]CAJ1445401.1 unnamed protein product [Effrenium voratum]